jgi:F0F1-type ATP synthase assembly protein I
LDGEYPSVPDSQNDSSGKSAEERVSAIRLAGRMMTIGFEFVFAIAIGTAGGFWADSVLHSKPYGILAGLIFGIAAAFYNLFKATGVFKRK